MQETQSAGEGRGDEAGQVADHAAADGHDDRLAIGAEFQHAFPEFRGHFHRLALFAGGDGHDGHLDRLADEAFGHLHRMRLLHVLVGEDDGVRDLAAVLEEAAGVGQVAGADLDIVAPLGQVDANGLEGGRHGESLSNVLITLRRDGITFITAERDEYVFTFPSTARVAGRNRDAAAETRVETDVFELSALAGSACNWASIRCRSAGFTRFNSSGQMVSDSWTSDSR